MRIVDTENGTLPGFSWPKITLNEAAPGFDWEDAATEPAFVCGRYPLFSVCQLLPTDLQLLEAYLRDKVDRRDRFLKEYWGSRLDVMQARREAACAYACYRLHTPWWVSMCDLSKCSISQTAYEIYSGVPPPFLVGFTFLSTLMFVALYFFVRARLWFQRADVSPASDVQEHLDMKEMLDSIGSNPAVILAMLKDGAEGYKKYLPEGAVNAHCLARLDVLLERRALRRRGKVLSFVGKSTWWCGNALYRVLEQIGIAAINVGEWVVSSTEVDFGGRAPMVVPEAPLPLGEPYIAPVWSDAEEDEVEKPFPLHAIPIGVYTPGGTAMIYGPGGVLTPAYPSEVPMQTAPPSVAPDGEEKFLLEKVSDLLELEPVTKDGAPLIPEGPLGAPKVSAAAVKQAEILLSTRVETRLRSEALVADALHKQEHDSILWQRARNEYADVRLARGIYLLDLTIDAKLACHYVSELGGLMLIYEKFSREMDGAARSDPAMVLKMQTLLMRTIRTIALYEKELKSGQLALKLAEEAWTNDAERVVDTSAMEEKIALERRAKEAEKALKQQQHEKREAEQRAIAEAAAMERAEKAREADRIATMHREVKARAKQQHEEDQRNEQQRAQIAREQRALVRFLAVQEREKADRELSKTKKFASAILMKARQAQDNEARTWTFDGSGPPSADGCVDWDNGLDTLRVPECKTDGDMQARRAFVADIRFKQIVEALVVDPTQERTLHDPYLLRFERQSRDIRREIASAEFEARLRLGNHFAFEHSLACEKMAERFRAEASLPDPDPSAPPSSYLPTPSITVSASDERALANFFDAAELAYLIDEDAEASIPASLVESFDSSLSVWGSVEGDRQITVPVSVLINGSLVGEGPRKKGNFSRRKREAIKVALDKCKTSRERSDTYAGLVGDTADEEFLAEMIDLIRTQEEEDRAEDEWEREHGMALDAMEDDEAALINRQDPRSAGGMSTVVIGNAVYNPEGPLMDDLFGRFCERLVADGKRLNRKSTKVMGRTVFFNDPTSLRSAFNNLTRVARGAKARPSTLRLVSSRKPRAADVVCSGIGDAVVARSLAGTVTKVISRREVETIDLPNDVKPIKLTPAFVAAEPTPKSEPLPEAPVPPEFLEPDVQKLLAFLRWEIPSIAFPAERSERMDHYRKLAALLAEKCQPAEKEISTQTEAPPAVPLVSEVPVKPAVAEVPSKPIRAEGPGISKVAISCSPCVIDAGRGAWNAPLVANRSMPPNIVLTFVLPLEYHDIPVHFKEIGEEPVDLKAWLPSGQLYSGKAYFHAGKDVWKKFVVVDLLLPAKTEGRNLDLSRFSRYVIQNARCTPKLGDGLLVRLLDKAKHLETMAMASVDFISEDGLELRHPGGTTWLNGQSDGVCGSLAYVNVEVNSGRMMKLFGVHCAAAPEGGTNVVYKLPPSFPKLHPKLM